MLFLVFISTFVVVSLYTYTINQSLTTVRENIQTTNLNQLRFVVNNLDQQTIQLNMLATALEVNSEVNLLSAIDIMDNYEQIRLKKNLREKMDLQSFSNGWHNQISIYSHLLDEWINTPWNRYTPPTGDVGVNWTYEASLGVFTTYRVNNDYTIRVSFPQNNLEVMLNNARDNTNNNDPFFFSTEKDVIINRYGDPSRIQEIILTLFPLIEEKIEGTEILSLDGEEYMVNYLRSTSLDWFMVDYLPKQQALHPILSTQKIFYVACIMLFFGSIITILFLYKKVQIPILTLLEGVRSLKDGNFAHRINKKSQNEFEFLYENFNEMAAQIEELIERVYKEKIISREAMVKQLQSQINPHFLYNCLFFVNNMNRLGNDEAVTKMTQNLAEYFRYTTKVDNPLTSLDKELGVVENYLTIQSLRMNRLHYEITIPESMKNIMVPKLLIQPLVENSVIHGIENKHNSGFIRISGIEDDNQYQIIVEDDGKGMSKEGIQELLQRMKQPLDDSMGCALWNIHQRMSIHFQGPSRLEITQSSLGGLRITLYWQKAT